jgi:hypothetical protein
MYEKRLAFLEDTYRNLDKRISVMTESGNFDTTEVSDLKKKKLQLKDEISRLRKLDWEEKHERVNFDDDR